MSSTAFAELTRWYTTSVVDLRQKEERDRAALDARLAELVGGNPQTAAIQQAFDAALSAATLAKSELVDAARLARDDASRSAADLRSAGMSLHERAYRSAVDKADRDYARAKEDAKIRYDAELKRIENAGRGFVEKVPLPPDENNYAMYNQHKHREKALQAYLAALADAKRTYERAWDDARAALQAASGDSLAAELSASEKDLVEEARKIEAAERDYERSVKNAKATYFKAIEAAAPDALREYSARRIALVESTERLRSELQQRFLDEKKRLGYA